MEALIIFKYNSLVIFPARPDVPIIETVVILILISMINFKIYSFLKIILKGFCLYNKIDNG
jgi:hypothetical protein